MIAAHMEDMERVAEPLEERFRQQAPRQLTTPLAGNQPARKRHPSARALMDRMALDPARVAY